MNLQSPKPRNELLHYPARKVLETEGERPSHVLWLDKNECIDPVYNMFIKNIISEIPVTALFAYPDFFSLYHKLAHNLHITVEQLILSAGSDGVIRAVFDTFISPGDVVIHPEPTYQMYRHYSKIYGATAIVLNYEFSDRGPILEVDKVINAIEQEKPRLVCLPNSASPTGTVFSPAEMNRIILAAGMSGAVILIDEAYYPFYDQTVLPLVSKYPHLVIARTFSKAWGLAGIRLGYGIACHDLMKELHKVKARYEITSISAAIAERVLDYSDVMLNSVKRLNQGKQFFINEMNQLNFHTFNSEGNFLLIAFDKYADAIHAALSDSIFYQKDFFHPAMKGYSRFTTTTQELFMPIVDKIKQTIKLEDLA